METKVLETINTWKNEPRLEKSLQEELNNLTGEALYDAFYKELTFGTGGLRGVLGVGINRMNIYTVGKATKGFANYLLNNYPNAKENGVVISYDCRNHSREFGEISASILAKMGIKAYLFSSMRPTPELSYAVRYLKCIAGIMITASHNPPEYNGYKVYDHNGCQLTIDAANEAIKEINKIKNLFAIETIDFEEGKKLGLITEIDKQIDEAYLNDVKLATIQNLPLETKKNLKVVFTPLHGTASTVLPAFLKKQGYDVVTVDEQMVPDPYFKTVKSPNPENPSAFEYAINLGKKVNADILLATDPDADRMGVAVRNKDGEYDLLTGNQTGAILLDYIGKNKNISKEGMVLNTIVTSNAAFDLCKKYNLTLVQTLTGFKFIGEQMEEIKNNPNQEFVFGYEESYGYVIEDIVRDKDSLQACLILCEVAAYYKTMNKSLTNVLNEIYQEIGFYKEEIYNINLLGESGAKQIEEMVRHFQNNHYQVIANKKIKAIEDYDKSIRYIDGKEEKITLPKSLVIKYIFEDGGWFVLRPSGTEPKLKIYVSVKDMNEQIANEFAINVKRELLQILKIN